MTTLEQAVREFISQGNRGGYTIAKKYGVDGDMDAFWNLFDKINEENWHQK